MRIDQIRQIAEVYEAGSINKAAQKLFISQSSLSASIRAAEEELGQKILGRSHKGIDLTDFGKAFIVTAKKILFLYDDILSKASSPEGGRLYISSQFLRYASSVFAALLSEYKGQVTNLRFTEKTRGGVCQDLMSKTSEIGLIVTPTKYHDRCVEMMEDSGLEYHFINTDECRCMVGRGSPLFTLESDLIQLEQLRPFPAVRYENDGGAWEKNELQKDYEDEFPHSGTLVISDSGSFQNILARTNGYFIGICNTHAYNITGFYDNIRVFSFVNKPFSYDTAWLCLKGQPLSPLAKEFLRRIYAVVGKAPEEILR
ncbi:MAG: LysR family transcriptional regulator [Clostridiaceae bacterium]|nr:LysR family transcriptional regulator [Clostridiaceae bacterium]